MKKLYVNLDTQQFVDVTGKVVTRQFSIDFATETQLSFQFLDAEHEIMDIETGDYYLAANNHLNDYDTCCFLSRDYVIEENVITFNVDTFNENFKRKVKNRDTKLFLELGFKAENSNSYLRLFSNEILAQPRVFVDGIAPPPITLYYTKNEVDGLIKDVQSEYLPNYQKEDIVNTLLTGSFNNVDFSLNKADCNSYMLFTNIQENSEAEGQLTFDLNFTYADTETGMNTRELHVRCNYNITSFIFKDCEPVDFEEELPLIENQDWTTHIFVVRLQKAYDDNGDSVIKTLITYAYSI